MHYLSIGAVFKNESWNMKEWLDHHLFHGVEHFYLIDDNSTDNYREILDPYIDQGLVTLFQCDVVKVPFDYTRQGNIYNKYLKGSDTFWLAIIDLDEFLWSPQVIDVKTVLRDYEANGQVIVNHLIFGDNGYDQHPQCLVRDLTMRGEEAVKLWYKMPAGQTVPDFWPVERSEDNRFAKNHSPGRKSIANMKYMDNLNVHGHESPEAPNINVSFQGLGPAARLLVNHYHCQSKQFWREIKAKRGSIGDVEDNYRDDWKVYESANVNDIADKRLYEQNKSLFPKQPSQPSEQDVTGSQ